MTATLTASAAILKLRYPKGELPKSVYSRSKAKVFFALPKETDWTGDNWQIALNTENPQGLSADHDTAVGSLAQGNYAKFSVDRKEYWAIARIKAQALKAAESAGEGALVALWKNETEAVALQALIDAEIFLLGNGTGVLGQVSSGSTVSSATITLTTITDAAKFALNMRVQAVSSATSLSPTVLSGIATITGIDRAAGTLTVSTTWSGQITGLVAGTHYLVRAGNYAASSTAKVLTGIKGWISQSSTTLFGLSTAADIIRYTGQLYDSSGVPHGEALIEASARVNQQGAPQPTLGISHPRTIGNFKKSVDARRTYTRDKYDTAAGVSFPALVVEGDEGEIKLLSSPFATSGECSLIDPQAWMLRSLGACPRVADFDGPEWLRVSGTDSYECKFVMWPNLGCTAPYGQIIVQNWNG